MREQLAIRDRPPAIGRALEKAADRIVQLQPSILRQQHDRGRNELLADRANLVHRVRRRRHLSRDIGQTVSLNFDDLSILDDRKRQTRYLRARHLGADVIVHLVCACRGGPGAHENDDERGDPAKSGWEWHAVLVRMRTVRGHRGRVDRIMSASFGRMVRVQVWRETSG